MKLIKFVLAFLPLFHLTAAPLQLKIASYNLRTNADKAPNDWPSRAPRAATVIQQEKLDIFGTQEVQRWHIKNLTALGYKVTGEAREYTHRAEFSAIFYNPESLELLNTRTFWLSETPNVPASRSWNTACPRICTYGIFKHKATGKIFLFANTHLDHRSADAKLNGAKLIIKELSQFPKDMPLILTGDFNSRPTAEPIKTVSSFLTDARSIAEKVQPGPNGTFNGYKPDWAYQPGRAPIDYIFVNRDAVKVKTFQVIDDFKNGLSSSDHFPVVATVVLQ